MFAGRLGAVAEDVRVGRGRGKGGGGRVVGARAVVAWLGYHVTVSAHTFAQATKQRPRPRCAVADDGGGLQVPASPGSEIVLIYMEGEDQEQQLPMATRQGWLVSRGNHQLFGIPRDWLPGPSHRRGSQRAARVHGNQSGEVWLLWTTN